MHDLLQSQKVHDNSLSTVFDQFVAGLSHKKRIPGDMTGFLPVVCMMNLKKGSLLCDDSRLTGRKKGLSSEIRPIVIVPKGLDNGCIIFKVLFLYIIYLL